MCQAKALIHIRKQMFGRDFFNIEAYVGPDPGGEGTGDGTEFIVHLKAGGTVGYALASKPKVTLSGNVFTVTTTDGVATYRALRSGEIHAQCGNSH